MGRYVIDETPSFREHVDADMNVIVAKILAHPLPPLKAILLTGGYGRGTGTPYLDHKLQTPYNDYDLVIVCDKQSRTEKQALEHKLYPLEAELAEELGIAVDLALIPINFLENSEFSLFNYEMKDGSRVLWGDPKILYVMPSYTIEKLPLMEGTRLLLNRGVLLWDNLNRQAIQTQLAPSEEKIFVKNLFKMHLAFGDILFIAAGCYEIDYRKKSEDISSLSFKTEIPHLPWIIENYRRAIDFKLHGNPKLYPQESLNLLMQETLANYIPIFLWFESCRLETPLKDIESYMNPTLLFTQDLSPLWKRLGLNFLLFKGSSLKPSWKWSFLHPRHRLFCALLLLLQKNLSLNDKQILNQLLNNHDNSTNTSFHKLWQRLA